MNWIDGVVIGIVVIAVILGYREGLLIGLFGLIGAVLGLSLVLWALPQVMTRYGPGMKVTSAALFFGTMIPVIGRAIGARIGYRIKRRIKFRVVHRADRVFGAVLAAATACALVWILGAAVSGTHLNVAPKVSEARTLKAIDATMPGVMNQVVRGYQRITRTTTVPRFLAPFTNEIIPNVEPPPPAVGATPGIRNAASRVAKITGMAPACQRGQTGSGFVFAPQRVMTNAHVLAGVRSPRVEIGGRRYTATVVHYDPRADVAVLHVPQLDATPLQFARGTADRSAVGAVLGYPQNGPYTVSPARVRGVQSITGPDIYNRGNVTREVYSVRGTVRPGNSGGPLVSANGQVLGVVFATSAKDRQTGYVLTNATVGRAIEAGRNATEPVSTQTCG